MTVKEKSSPVTFKIKLFGSLREAAGNKEVALSLDGESITVSDLKRNLNESYPKFASSKANIIVTVNRKVAADSTAIMPSDEIALLPLVSGG